jgi:hypothetical protein
MWNFLKTGGALLVILLVPTGMTRLWSCEDELQAILGNDSMVAGVIVLGTILIMVIAFTSWCRLWKYLEKKR